MYEINGHHCVPRSCYNQFPLYVCILRSYLYAFRMRSHRLLVSSHTSLALHFPAQFCPYYSSLLLFRLSTIPIEATMNFIILQPNDRHRTVDIESDSTFGVAMDAAAMRGRCDDDGWSIERTLQRRSSRLRGQILRESCSSEYMPMALDGRSA